ncbi:hypothetical protein [Brevibacillus choshinensis]|uniref:hypothetical protein n=1 Tax=Brevibacillus choshinensis TaxID=54911 RepID=UPI002E1DC3B0|nr:hypothetical protein [Brevibacillus choshinensis]
MEVNPVTKKYQAIDTEIVLFNEEYYLSVIHVDISALATPDRESLFTHLFEFDSKDIELEIDVSEEHIGNWFLQVLVPHVLTLPDVARKRLERGREELAAHLAKQSVNPTQAQLFGDDIYQYVKRYNPHLQVIG